MNSHWIVTHTGSGKTEQVVVPHYQDPDDALFAYACRHDPGFREKYWSSDLFAPMTMLAKTLLGVEARFVSAAA